MFKSDGDARLASESDGGSPSKIATLEEMLPHLRPGGVFACEAVRGELNRFNAFVHGLAANLNASDFIPGLQGKELACAAIPFNPKFTPCTAIPK